MKKVQENLTHEEFNEMCLNAECSLDGITHWTEDVKVPYHNGVYKTECYEESGNNSIEILYSKNEDGTYNIFEW